MRTRRIPASLLTLASLLALAGCTGWQSALDVQGSPAITLKQLIVLIVALCSVVWALVMVALILALWRRRGVRERLVVDPSTELRMTAAVVTAVAASVIIISAFTIFSFFTTRVERGQSRRPHRHGARPAVVVGS